MELTEEKDKEERERCGGENENDYEGRERVGSYQVVRAVRVGVGRAVGQWSPIGVRRRARRVSGVVGVNSAVRSVMPGLARSFEVGAVAGRVVNFAPAGLRISTRRVRPSCVSVAVRESAERAIFPAVRSRETRGVWGFRPVRSSWTRTRARSRRAMPRRIFFAAPG
jgi:hypothetical protein